MRSAPRPGTARTCRTSEHTRYVRHLLELLGNCMDAFTGAMLNLKKQTATVQYKVGSERDALLNSTSAQILKTWTPTSSSASARDRWCKKSGAEP